MRYSLVIKKLDKNEDYEKEKQVWEEQHNRPWMNSPEPTFPQRELKTLALETIITEEEFKKIKKAVMEVM